MHIKVNALHPCTLHYKAVRSRKETMRRWGGGTAAQGESTARHRPKLSAGPTKMGRRRIIEMEADTTAHRSRFEAMTGFEYNKKMNAKGHGVVVKRGEGGGRKLTSKNISYPCSAVPKRITGRGSGVFLSNIGTTASTADLRINASVERERERENGENNNGGDNNNNNGRCPGERVSNVSKLGPNSAVLPNCLCECEQRKHCKQIGATQEMNGASSNNNNHDEHASSSCKSLEALLAQSLLSPISIPSFPRVVHSNCPAEAEAAALKPHKMRISPHTRMPSSKSENKKNDSLLAPPQACVFSPPRWGLRHSTTGLEESHCKEKKNNDRYETNTNVKSIDHTLPTPHHACRMKRNENSVSKPLNPWHTPAEHNGSDKTSTSTATDVIATIEFNPSRQFVDKIASRGKGVRRHYVTSTAAHKDRKQGATSLGLSRRKSLARRSSRVQLTKPSVGDVNNSSNRADLLLGPSSSSHTDLSRWNKLFDRKPTQRLLTSGHLFASVSKTGARVVRENTARRNRGDGTNKHPYPGTSCAAIDGDVGGATDFNNNHQLVSRSDPNNHLGLEMGLASAGCSSTFRKFRDSFLFVPSSAVENESTSPSAAAPAATRTRQTDYPQNTTAAAFEWMNEGRNDCALAFDLVPPRELVGVLPSSSPFRLMTTTAHDKCGEINNTNNNHTNCGNYDYDYYGNPNIYNSKSGHKEGPLASTTACISGETIVPRPSLDHNDIPYGRLCHNPNLDLCPPLPREWPRSAWHDHRIGYPNQEEDSSVPYFSLPFNGRPPFNVSPAEGPRIDHQSIMATNAFHHHPYNNQHHHHHYHENQKVSNDVIINDHHFSSPWSFGYGYSSYGGGDAAAAVDFQNVLRSPPPDLLHNSVSKNTMYVSRSANPTALLHPHSEEVWRSAGLTANSTVNPSNKGNRVCSHATAAQGGRPLQTTTTTTTTTFDPYAEMVSPFAFK